MPIRKTQKIANISSGKNKGSENDFTSGIIIVIMRFVTVAVVLLLVQYYSYILVRSNAREMSIVADRVLTIGYVIIDLLVILAIVTMRNKVWPMPLSIKEAIVAFVIGFVVAQVLVSAVMLADDIRRLIKWGVNYSVTASGGVHIQRSEFLRASASVLAGITIGGFMLGMGNRYRYRVRRLSLSFESLPSAFRGMKIVQVSDIHSGSFEDVSAVRRGVQMIMDEHADLILFTGDLVNNSSDEVGVYQDIFSTLKAPMGVFSILGNHDYGDYISWPTPQAKAANLQRLKDIHKEMGWTMLNNAHTILERDGQYIALIGVENWSSRLSFPKHGDIALAKSGTKDVPFKILMSHDPSHWDAEISKDHPDIDLTLSGHTHGMQFGIDIPGIKWSPVQWVYPHWAGLYSKGHQHLYADQQASASSAIPAGWAYCQRLPS